MRVGIERVQNPLVECPCAGAVVAVDGAGGSDMRVGTQAGPSLAEVPETARQAEALGYDFLTSGETSQNAFFPLVLAAEHTRRVELRTSIALAFARSPMDTAYMAWDLQRLSNGRFCSRPGQPGQGPRRPAFRHGVVASRRPDAGVPVGPALHLELLADGRKARRQHPALLHEPDAAGLQSRPPA